jgi:predicted lipoprotein with Yx(FWY)xxD motif
MYPTINQARMRPFLGLVGALLVVAACSSSGGASASPTAASTAPSVAPSASAAASASASAAAGGEVYEVKVATGAVGSYLVGEDGKTLYMFTVDAPNKSNCNGDCATTWPPFIVSDDDTLKAGDGVTGTLTTFARADGTKQVAINGVPLYYYKVDKAAGDTNGQGVGGKWFVVPPAGPSASPSASTAAEPGY